METNNNRSEHRVWDPSALLAKGMELVKRHRAWAAMTAMVLMCLVMLFAVTAALMPVIVDDDGVTRTVLTLGRTPETILAGAGITLADDDVVTASLDGPEKRICIERAFDVSITVNDGDSTVVRLTNGTVNDALKLAGVETGAGTVMNVATNAPLSDGLNICVEQLESKTRVTTEDVEYVTTYRYTNEKPVGSRVYLQVGKVGEKTCTYTDYLQNGEVVRSELVSQELTKQPVNAVVLVGQGEAPAMATKFPLDENGIPTSYKSVITGKACAYTAKAGAVTATGTVPQIGTVAVNPKIIPYGSKLFIVSDDGYVYGYATAEDTGGALMSNKIIADLYMDTKEDCYQFGRRSVKVYILE